ncbi:hypothetical protein GE115_04695 [Agromyces sp. CFH 90414]|uniref:Uncharacterized protein n=1 Tax=Agromyces agglutinans TaxID=2662258 RepID=A0A6I2FDJ9_9MICO|nr:hypothetical protein [Agromyces agglutinans]MRG59168.1 hypothetical protein [Agromyces agglutinans]
MGASTKTTRRPAQRVAAWGLAAALAAGALAATAPPPAAAEVPEASALANLDHLDFLLDTATPTPEPGHTTYRLAEEPELVQPWTYADARPGGTFERVGGGPLDPVTGDWGQGAYNADDTSRAAVVYLRHWRQTGEETSRDTAYELLRSLAYLQTSEGQNAGNVVLWMQPDGDLNPSAEPVELPDPSDSGPSYWLARTLWAFGEGYAAFAADGGDPGFTAFLADRLALARDAVDRQVLTRYGEYAISDGWRVPAWLIVDGADATAEAVLGLAAYVEAAPDDAAARDTLAKLAEGVAAMSAGDVDSWPYGAILPWAKSSTLWHAWGSQMPAALAEASAVLDDPTLLEPAVRDSSTFTPTLLTAGGPDNGWFPTPTDRVQIAYGADSRLQSLLAVADASGSPGFEQLAAMQAAWYFGANRSGQVMYDPTTGVTFDGLQADGSINRNGGAESTIHGQLSMLALDERPEVAARAVAVSEVGERIGLTSLEAEDATSTTGDLVTPASAWTGESSYSGDTLVLERGETAAWALPNPAERWSVEPVAWLPADSSGLSIWRRGGSLPGLVAATGREQGISASDEPGALAPQAVLPDLRPVSAELSTRVLHGELRLDALIVRPLISRLLLTGADAATELVHSSSVLPRRATVGFATLPSVVRVSSSTGQLVAERSLGPGSSTIVLPPGGFAVTTAG